jgi:SAM-dependent methyltransferase
MNFKDHFSGHSRQYSAFRPRYPDTLFSWLSSLCKEHRLAWDCATGSGQAATGLIGYFDQVIATDASANQISDAIQAPGVSYSVASAEMSGISSDSVDLITVAQALHWFDIHAFAAEAHRVLKVDGVLAVWTYGLVSFGEGLDEIIGRLYADIVGEYWPPERKLVESGYAGVQLPLTEIPAEAMEMTETWKFANLIGYLNTWSAVKTYEKARGSSPLESVRSDLLHNWGEPNDSRIAAWPLSLKVWRKPHRL